MSFYFTWLCTYLLLKSINSETVIASIGSVNGASMLHFSGSLLAGILQLSNIDSC